LKRLRNRVDGGVLAPVESACIRLSIVDTRLYVTRKITPRRIVISGLAPWRWDDWHPSSSACGKVSKTIESTCMAASDHALRKDHVIVAGGGTGRQ